MVSCYCTISTGLESVPNASGLSFWGLVDENCVSYVVYSKNWFAAKQIPDPQVIKAQYLSYLLFTITYTFFWSPGISKSFSTNSSYWTILLQLQLTHCSLLASVDTLVSFLVNTPVLFLAGTSFSPLVNVSFSFLLTCWFLSSQHCKYSELCHIWFLHQHKCHQNGQQSGRKLGFSMNWLPSNDLVAVDMLSNGPTSITGSSRCGQSTLLCCQMCP